MNTKIYVVSGTEPGLMGAIEAYINFKDALDYVVERIKDLVSTTIEESVDKECDVRFNYENISMHYDAEKFYDHTETIVVEYNEPKPVTENGKPIDLNWAFAIQTVELKTALE